MVLAAYRKQEAAGISCLLCGYTNTSGRWRQRNHLDTGPYYRTQDPHTAVRGVVLHCALFLLGLGHFIVQVESRYQNGYRRAECQMVTHTSLKWHYGPPNGKGMAASGMEVSLSIRSLASFSAILRENRSREAASACSIRRASACAPNVGPCS